MAYESCVIDAAGNCTRWNHDHEPPGPEYAPGGPMDARLILPERIDVTAANDGVALAVHDHPARKPIAVVALTTDQAITLMDALATALGFDLRKKDA